MSTDQSPDGFLHEPLLPAQVLATAFVVEVCAQSAHVECVASRADINATETRDTLTV